jgi:hypothetical protein
MKELRYTLVTDGPSDDALIPPLTWLLREQGVACAIAPTWADLSRLRRRPRGLRERISLSIFLYPCDLLFVHRDAEHQPPELRKEEIRNALAEWDAKVSLPPVVHVISIHMTEAWLFF